MGKNGGWSQAGIVCYNVIYDKVLKDRKLEKSRAFNNYFIMHYHTIKQTIAMVATRGRGRAATNQDELPGLWNRPKING